MLDCMDAFGNNPPPRSEAEAELGAKGIASGGTAETVELVLALRVVSSD